MKIVNQSDCDLFAEDSHEMIDLTQEEEIIVSISSTESVSVAPSLNRALLSPQLSNIQEEDIPSTPIPDSSPKSDNVLEIIDSESTVSEYDYQQNLNRSYESMLMRNEKSILEESFREMIDLNESVNEVIFHKKYPKEMEPTTKNSRNSLKRFSSEPVLLKNQVMVTPTVEERSFEISSDDDEEEDSKKTEKLKGIPENEDSWDEFDRMVYCPKYVPKSLQKSVSPPPAIQSPLIPPVVIEEDDRIDLTQTNSDNVEISSDDDEEHDEFEELILSDDAEEDVPRLNFDEEKYIYKTRNVSPQLDYKNMTSEGLEIELKRFGLKSLSKKRAIMILEYIYHQTHPYIQLPTDDLIIQSQPMSKTSGPKKKKQSQSIDFEFVDPNVDLLADDGIKTILLENEEYILPSKGRRKIHSCSLPLQIAFTNLFKSNSQLRRTVLCYEPIELEELYSYFKGLGVKYETNVSR